MSFLIEESEEEFSAVSSRLGCPNAGNIIDSKDSNSEAMKGENLETNNLQIDKPQTDKSQLPELKLESGSEFNVAHSSECSGQACTSNQAVQLQGPSSNATRKTEGAPAISVKAVHISPTPKIVNRLSQLKKKNIRGPSKRLTRKILKDLTADLPLLPS